MNVLVIDGQGGGLGRQLVAVGTNSVAAQAMHKAGAPRAATGENAVVAVSYTHLTLPTNREV